MNEGKDRGTANNARCCMGRRAAVAPGVVPDVATMSGAAMEIKIKMNPRTNW
jgi:hypothetical protein